MALLVCFCFGSSTQAGLVHKDIFRKNSGLTLKLWFQDYFVLLLPSSVVCLSHKTIPKSSVQLMSNIPAAPTSSSGITGLPKRTQSSPEERGAPKGSSGAQGLNRVRLQCEHNTLLGFGFNKKSVFRGLVWRGPRPIRSNCRSGVAGLSMSPIGRRTPV